MFTNLFLTISDIPFLFAQDTFFFNNDVIPEFAKYQGILTGRAFYERGQDIVAGLFDIRWVFPTSTQASLFLQEATPSLSERMIPIASAPIIGDESTTFTFEHLLQGYSMNHINFVFRIQCVVAKIFVSGDLNVSSEPVAQSAYLIVDTAVQRITHILELDIEPDELVE